MKKMTNSAVHHANTFSNGKVSQQTVKCRHTTFVLSSRVSLPATSSGETEKLSLLPYVVVLMRSYLILRNRVVGKLPCLNFQLCER